MISKVPDIIPIFPLPETVLLPSEVLPLHVFEPRYRDMVRDALDTHRVIGMVMLKPGYESSYEGAPPVREIGCAGVIARHQELADGRYLIWLLGVERFRISRELPASTKYRQVEIDHQHLTWSGEEKASVQALRRELLAALPLFIDPQVAAENSLDEKLAKLDDVQFVAVASQILDVTGDDKQQLLEYTSLVDRYLHLHERLQLRRQNLPASLQVKPEDLN